TKRTRAIGPLTGLSSPCRPDVHVVEYFLAVVEECEAAADEVHVEDLPLASRFRRVRGWSNLSIQRAAAIRRRWFSVAVEDLDLVLVAHVDARVAGCAGHYLELDMQIEIVELLVRLDVGARRRVHVLAVDDSPAVWAVALAQMPARQILPVEQPPPP